MKIKSLTFHYILLVIYYYILCVPLVALMYIAKRNGVYDNRNTEADDYL